MIEQNVIPNKKPFYADRQKLIILGVLAMIIGLGAFLRFYDLGSSGVGNSYYAAAVKSMLMSWKNFFFVAFEPGGSVSVDKPPLGFWVQTVSAYFLGVNGFALALPNVLAGVLSILMVYILLKRPFGPWAALLGALVLAVMPVAVATERNNTIDGLLVFVLLAAAWVFLKAAQSGKLRWLMLGAFIVGLGFNIKMLQAFLPLPAFYALYFFGAKHPIRKKLLHLAAATVLLLVISFSWAAAVDLTPAADRPYVDSTSTNSAIALIFGHNGIERLTNNGGGGGFTPGTANHTAAMLQAPGGTGMPPQGGPGGSNNGQSGPMGGGPGGSMDFGTAGTLRLFTTPLAGEASWLLPLALGGLIMAAVLLRKRPMGEAHLALILWAGWLVPEALYFSYSQGLMHAYYLIMLGAPIAGLTGTAGWAIWQTIQRRRLLGWGLAFLLAGGTLAFQTYLLWDSTSWAGLSAAAAALLLASALALAAASRFSTRLAAPAAAILLTTLLAAPLTWSLLTTFNHSANEQLPAAGPAQQGRMGPGNRSGGNGPTPMDGNGSQAQMQLAANRGSNLTMGPGGGGDNQALLSYLLAHTQTSTYLVATGRAQDAAGYILATGRPVLALGGFLGQYDEFSLDQFKTLVNHGQLRFVLGSALDQHQVISQWVQQNCSLVNDSSVAGTTLYDCEK